jgi:hypothetical protein
MAYKQKGFPMHSTASALKQTRFVDKITALINSPIEDASYSELKKAYRMARKYGQNPADLDIDELRSYLSGEKPLSLNRIPRNVR